MRCSEWKRKSLPESLGKALDIKTASAAKSGGVGKGVLMQLLPVQHEADVVGGIKFLLSAQIPVTVIVISETQSDAVLIGLERKIESGVLVEAETAQVFDGRRKLDTIDRRTPRERFLLLETKV